MTLTGCETRPKLIEGTYFDVVTVDGTANIGGSQTKIKSEFKNVYLIHEDSLVEMLKQR